MSKKFTELCAKKTVSECPQCEFFEKCKKGICLGEDVLAEIEEEADA